MPFYSILGLTLHADRTLPGLEALPRGLPSANTFRVQWGSLPHFLSSTNAAAESVWAWYVSREKNGVGTPILSVWRHRRSGTFWFRYEDGVEFAVQPEHKQIWSAWKSPMTSEDAATYLTGPILGFALSQLGKTCLHASSVVLDGQVVAFAGEGGAGKSAIAATFAKSGHPVLADDVVVLHERREVFLAQPAYPRLRLWPSTVKLLFGASASLPRIVPTHPSWDKCSLDLTQNGYQFHRVPALLARIYLLEEPPSPTNRPKIKAVTRAEGYVALLGLVYVNYLKDKNQQAADFQRLGRLAKQVTIKRLQLSCNPACLARLPDVILRDLEISHPQYV